jgi:hypothetical protein
LKSSLQIIKIKEILNKKTDNKENNSRSVKLPSNSRSPELKKKSDAGTKKLCHKILNFSF